MCSFLGFNHHHHHRGLSKLKLVGIQRHIQKHSSAAGGWYNPLRRHRTRYEEMHGLKISSDLQRTVAVWVKKS